MPSIAVSKSNVSTRERIKAAFEEARGARLSGPELARQIRISRAAVWKSVKSWKPMASRLPERPAADTGSRGPPDFSLARLPRKAIRGLVVHYRIRTIPLKCRRGKARKLDFRKGMSGWRKCRAPGKGGSEGPGRPRTAACGLPFCCGRVSAAACASLGLVVGLALWRSLKSFDSTLRIGLKWPNDLLGESPKGRRKLAGILVEVSGEVDQTQWVVVGVGLNVFNQVPAGLRATAASLESLMPRAPSRAELLRRFWREFSGAYDRFRKQGFAPFQADYQNASWTVGRPVRVRTSQGLISGHAVGIGTRGGSRIDSASQTDVLYEGEVLA